MYGNRISDGAPSSRRFWLLAAALSTSLTVSCGVEASDTRADLPTTARGGESPVAVDTFGPALAGLGEDRLLVWGGLPVSDPATKNLSNGSILALPSGTRVEVPDDPFGVPVANPRAAAKGDRALVVGQSCSEWVDADYGRQCRPGVLLGAVLDVSSEEWTPVASGVLDSFQSVVSTDVSTDGAVLISSAEQPRSIVTVDLDSAVATLLPSPPLESRSDDETAATVACVTKTDVLLAERTAPPGFQAGVSERSPARLYAFSLEERVWRKLASPSGIWDPVMTCTDEGALLSNGVGINFGLEWFRVEGETWLEVKPPPGTPAAYSVRTRSGDDVLLFDGTAAGPGLRYTPSENLLGPVSGETMPFDCDWGQCIAATGAYVGGATRTPSEPAATEIFWFKP